MAEVGVSARLGWSAAIVVSVGLIVSIGLANTPAASADAPPPPTPVPQTEPPTNSAPAPVAPPADNLDLPAPALPESPQTPPTPLPINGMPGNVIELPSLQEVDKLLPSVEESFHLVIRLKKRRVYLYQGEDVHASYPIAVGRQGWETPKGTFKIIEMKKNPSWQNPFTGEVIPPGSDNPLGSRWIGFWTNGKNYIGFHGTPNEGSVGRAASHGCIRMFDKDVQKLFEQVKVGTPVMVTD